MRYRIFLLLSIMLASTLTLTTVASAHHNSWQRSPSIRDQELSRTQIYGTIESINGTRATVITQDGELYGVALGPQYYWGARVGRYLRPGCQVNVDAWGDPYGRSDWYYAASISGPGFSMAFTNGDGVPYWEDFSCTPDWCPTYDTFADWYGCNNVVYNYILPPPRPVRYYTWYPRGYYPDRYRHYYRGYDFRHHDNGRHLGWNRGRGDDDQYNDRNGDGYDRQDDGYRGGPRGSRRGR